MGKGKGGKNRRRGKNEGEEKRELIFKEDGQEYAQVIRMLGNGRLDAQCIDGVKRLCHIRGKMRKKVWVSTGDIILVGLRDFQDEKADVILKYNADEARSLKAYGELPDNIRVNETETFNEEENENDAAARNDCECSQLLFGRVECDGQDEEQAQREGLFSFPTQRKSFVTHHLKTGFTTTGKK